MRRRVVKAVASNTINYFNIFVVSVWGTVCGICIHRTFIKNK